MITCFECGGTLNLKGGIDRVFVYRKGSEFVLPSDFEIPTCDNCGSDFLDEELENKAKELFRPMFLKEQNEHLEFLIKTIQTNTGMTLREIERACGVIDTYLSHILSGRKEASEVLIGQLEGFAIYPGEAKRRLDRKVFHDTDSVRFACSLQKK